MPPSSYHLVASPTTTADRGDPVFQRLDVGLEFRRLGHRRTRQLTRLSWRRWNLETSCSSKRATSPTGSRACRDSAVILRAVSAMGSERLSKGSYSPRSRDKGLRFTPFWTIQYS